jgi:hypothetical protein
VTRGQPGTDLGDPVLDVRRRLVGPHRLHDFAAPDAAFVKNAAEATDLGTVRHILPGVEACARETFIRKRNTVKHNRGTDMFEAGNIRFGLEMRRQRSGDGGLALHVPGDPGGSRTESSAP